MTYFDTFLTIHGVETLISPTHPPPFKINNPLKTSSISQSHQHLVGGNHRGQCWVMSPWLHRSDDSLQEPLGPLKSQTYDPHSPDSHFPTRSDSSIHQDVSNTPDLCLCLLILNLCSLWGFFLLPNKHEDVTGTHKLWFMTGRRRLAIFNLFSVQIMMWTRDEFRLYHQEWTSPRWVIQNMLSHKSKSFNVIISRFCPWLFYLSCRFIAPL